MGVTTCPPDVAVPGMRICGMRVVEYASKCLPILI